MTSPISSVGSLSPGMSSPDIKPDISSLAVTSPPGSYFSYGMHQGMTTVQSGSIHSPPLHSPSSSVASPSMMSIGSPGSVGSPPNPHMPHTTLSNKHICAICGDRASGKHYGVYRLVYTKPYYFLVDTMFSLYNEICRGHQTYKLMSALKIPFLCPFLGLCAHI